MEGFFLKGLLSLVILTNFIFPPGSTSILTNNPVENPVNAFLSGTSSGPDITVSRFDIDFGTVSVNSSSTPHILTVTNIGDKDLDIGTITIDDSQFSITFGNISDETLASGISANISLIFTPSSTGSQSGQMSIPSNDPQQNTITVWLFGIGGDPATFTLNYSDSPGGTLSGNTSQTVSYNGSGTPVTAVPNTGYVFVDWSDNSTDNPRTDTNVIA
ncbi:MAG: choice-of-anchor D domain-containing protein, partial [Dehalococcoidales bacterium]|nr:choice-of-anchor D domain-containing protein [Dehalococcoidales bacterium]